jgi:hypothetical protein
MPKKIAVIDLDSVVYSIGIGKKVIGADGKPLKENGRLVYIDKTNPELADTADRVMSNILTKCGATHYIGYLKGKDTTLFRTSINSSYKANRSGDRPAWFPFVENCLIQNWKAIPVDNYEVDDYVLATRNIYEAAGYETFIVAIDGDLLGQEGKHFKWRVKDSFDGEWITVTKDQAEYKFWKDMIVGQPGDNVGGLKGKGEAYWKKQYPFGVTALRQSVFTDYTLTLGEYEGIKEFYKNYISLRTLEKIPGIAVPDPIEFRAQSTVLEEQNLFT